MTPIKTLRGTFHSNGRRRTIHGHPWQTGKEVVGLHERIREGVLDAQHGAAPHHCLPTGGESHSAPKKTSQSLQTSSHSPRGDTPEAMVCAAHAVDKEGVKDQAVQELGPGACDPPLCCLREGDHVWREGTTYQLIDAHPPYPRAASTRMVTTSGVATPAPSSFGGTFTSQA